MIKKVGKGIGKGAVAVGKVALKGVKYLAKTENLIKIACAVLEYSGKSKDVYGLPNGNVLMVFKDLVTGIKGKEDPGANQVMGEKEGIGNKALAMSSLIFDEISKHLKIPTQNIVTHLDANALEAKRAQMFGQGLEFISRNKAWGTFLERMKNYSQGDSLISKFGVPYTEVSLKDDEKGDPFVTLDELLKLGTINEKDYQTCVDYLQRITIFLTEMFNQKKMELIDMKVEFGKDRNGNIMLIDELSMGSLRALINGEIASKEAIFEAFMKPQV